MRNVCTMLLTYWFLIVYLMFYRQIGTAGSCLSLKSSRHLAHFGKANIQPIEIKYKIGNKNWGFLVLEKPEPEVHFPGRPSLLYQAILTSQPFVSLETKYYLMPSDFVKSFDLGLCCAKLSVCCLCAYTGRFVSQNLEAPPLRPMHYPWQIYYNMSHEAIIFTSLT